jgi:hypothetical protein
LERKGSSFGSFAVARKTMPDQADANDFDQYFCIRKKKGAICIKSGICRG